MYQLYLKYKIHLSILNICISVTNYS